MYVRLSTKVLLLITFWITINFVFAEQDCTPETFAISPTYNNMKPEDIPLKVINVTNRMECATRCYRQQKCSGFIISSAGSVCSMYERRYKAMTFVNESGTQAYEILSGDPLDCSDSFKRGFRISGVYTIKPRDSDQPMNVSCHMSLVIGWLVIQRRTDGSQKFYRRWNEYRDGFGDLNNEFWLGNINIHRITSQANYMLMINLEDFNGNTKYAMYQHFSVSLEDDSFRLTVGGYIGTAGDGLGPHNGSRFSASDMDLDNNPNRNCALEFKSGWWYNECNYSNLNGKYLVGFHSSYGEGVDWAPWLGFNYSLKKTKMMIAPTTL